MYKKKNGIAGHTGCFKHLGLWSWSTVDIRQRKLFFFASAFCSDSVRILQWPGTNDIIRHPMRLPGRKARKQVSVRLPERKVRKELRKLMLVSQLNVFLRILTRSDRLARLFSCFVFFTLACDWRRALLLENVFENQQLRAEGAGACTSLCAKKAMLPPSSGLGKHR